MRDNLSPIILTGPSQVGKSKIAEFWSDMTGAQIVNADKYYLYAGEYFMLGIGLRPGELHDGRARHLFGCLNPPDPLPGADEFAVRAAHAIEKIHAGGNMAIVEGCSYTYTTALVGRYGLQHAMRMSGGDKYSCNLKRHCFRAYCELVGLGLYEETERALEAGLADSFPMMSLIYRHTIPFINGEITQTESTRLVVNEWVRAITETNKKFELIERLISIP